ncbi:MAG: CHASE3 domain-containing protein [Roseiarcus sp.]|uniref:CHASE3 domain-containing protein n=1 Tax=Roseiarcus sp. TaxID=1969460 RepID=UPI003C6AE949
MPNSESGFGFGQSWPNLGRRAANILALASFGLVILAGLLAAVMVERVNSTADWVAHSLEVEGGASELLGKLQDLELAKRGFLLTRSDGFIPSYDEARTAIPQALAKLRSLVADSRDQTARVDRMGLSIQDILTTSARTIELGRNGQFAEAIAFVMAGRGQQTLESFRAIVNEFNAAESDLLKKREAAEATARAIMLGMVLVFLASAAGAALGALLLSGALIRELRQRTEALAEETRVRKDTQAILAQTQKMESIGQLAGGIAHDFNNLMTVVIGNLDSAERRLARGGPADASSIGRPIAAAMQGARRAASLTQRLLAFSRQQVLSPQQVDLNRLVASLSEMLTRTVGETIAVETILGSGLWPTFVDVSQLENAIVNLVVNARDAMPDGGRITIETANASLDEAYCRQFGDVAPGQYVLISVTDTGTGISPENLTKVFEPFFTTKSASMRTGLGLAMIYGFVKQSKGHIRIYSEVGHGTTAKIYLPRMIGAARAESVPAAARVESAQSPTARPGEVVLMVEDDEDVLNSTVVLLRELGYSVLTARNGAEALAQLKGGKRVDILFTDVVLPQGMNGRMVAVEALALRPALPVLFTTGYARNAIVHNGQLDPDVQFLAKPYTLEELAQKLRAGLDGAAPAL